jgi:hypothetical protein
VVSDEICHHLSHFPLNVLCHFSSSILRFFCFVATWFRRIWGWFSFKLSPLCHLLCFLTLIRLFPMFGEISPSFFKYSFFHQFLCPFLEL